MGLSIQFESYTVNHVHNFWALLQQRGSPEALFFSGHLKMALTCSVDYHSLSRTLRWL